MFMKSSTGGRRSQPMAHAICRFGEDDIPASRIRYSKVCEIILITILRLRYAYGFYRSSITFIEFRKNSAYREYAAYHAPLPRLRLLEVEWHCSDSRPSSIFMRGNFAEGVKGLRHLAYIIGSCLIRG